MKRILSRRFYILGGSGLAAVLLVGGLLYLLTQSLLENVIATQLKQAGYAQAKVEGVRVYVDGVVVGHIALTKDMNLYDLYTPQSARDIATQGLRQLIIRRWVQVVPDLSSLTLKWPFPKLERLSIEAMDLALGLPLQTVNLAGTVKSLQPDTGRMVLLMPYRVEQKNYNLQGNMEIDLVGGKVDTIDFNLEDGSYEDPSFALRRLNGWMNIQNHSDGIKAEAQFTSGAVRYAGYDFADSMAQYSSPTGTEGQWTVTLNRPAENYFNTWVIKPTTRPDRYAVQVAAQSGDETKTRTLVSGLPLHLDLLLVPPQAQEPLAERLVQD